jgi:hypothetical protein
MKAKRMLAWPEQPPDGKIYFPISRGVLVGLYSLIYSVQSVF